MSGTITLALRTAQSGLLASQTALEAVANNVANVNTEGYSRQIVNFEQRAVAGIGAGVQVADFSRRVDEGLLKSLRFELTSLKTLEIQDAYFARTQELFGSPGDNTSLSHLINSFSAAIESLALAAEGSIEQRDTVRWADELASQFQDMSRTIQELRQQADVQIGQAVEEINDLVARINDLNTQIIRNSNTGLSVNDLKDQRDIHLNRLSELMDIRIFSRSDGDVVVFTASGRSLVDSVPGLVTHVPAASVGASTTHAEGNLDGIYIGPQIAGNDITNDLRGGELAGLVELRDLTLTSLQSQIDELAAELRDMVNGYHNRGVAFPGLDSATGSRIFVDSSLQTMTLGSGEDVVIALFDNNGDQAAATRLQTIMQSASFGSGAQAANGPWTIDEVAATVEDWLQANGAASATVAVNSAGQLAVNVNNTSLHLGFRDEAATTNGSARQDASIAFDANGDGTIDETVSGFSYFFGLNDLFVDNMPENIHETNVLDNGFTATAATLTFRNAGGVIGAPLAINAGDSLATIAAAFDNITGLSASVVPEGAGSRIRIASDDGASITVTQAAGNTLLNDIGMHVIETGVASNISVRSDILSQPNRISRAALQWDASKGAAGAYFVSVGDATVAHEMAEALRGNNSFDGAGSLTPMVVSFSDYAASIVSGNATAAETNATQLVFQDALVSNLKQKSDTISGVNLDEEMSEMILFQQAFSASARLVGIIQEMFDALERAV